MTVTSSAARLAAAQHTRDDRRLDYGVHVLNHPEGDEASCS